MQQTTKLAGAFTKFAMGRPALSTLMMLLMIAFGLWFGYYLAYVFTFAILLLVAWFFHHWDLLLKLLLLATGVWLVYLLVRFCLRLFHVKNKPTRVSKKARDVANTFSK